MWSKIKRSYGLYRFIVMFFSFLIILNVLNISIHGASAVSEEGEIIEVEKPHFTDVKETDYFYEAVQEMADMGYVNGYGDLTFRPLNNITLAESLTILFRISGYDVPVLNNSEYWYSSVWSEALKMGIVSNIDDPNDYATRLDISKYIIDLYQIDISLTTISDVFSDTNLLAANTMYQYGIFIGSPTDKGIVFMPNSNITRGDLSLVVYRLNEKLNSPYMGTMLIGDYEINVNPTTVEDYLLIMKVLGESGELSITIPYSRDLANISYYLKIRESAIDAFERSFAMYPEYFSFTPTLSLKRDIYSYNSGAITLTISNNDIPSEVVLLMRDEFEIACTSIVDELYAYEVINENTLTIDKVRLFYEYVALHCSFDTSYSINSFTGYGAAVEGLAVCQGYTAMFNNLCRIAGLDVIAITGRIVDTNEPHMWSAVYDEDNSAWILCDVTFGDPVLEGEEYKDYYDLKYFNIPEEELMVGRIKDWE